jgi:hypothetical protein
MVLPCTDNPLSRLEKYVAKSKGSQDKSSVVTEAEALAAKYAELDAKHAEERAALGEEVKEMHVSTGKYLADPKLSEEERNEVRVALGALSRTSGVQAPPEADPDYKAPDPDKAPTA